MTLCLTNGTQRFSTIYTNIMNIKTLTLALICSAIIPAIGYAERLTPEQALKRINEFQPHKAMAVHGNTFSLKKTYNVSADNTPAFFVFDHNDSGFIILSADDRLPAMLADVQGEAFDENRLPDNLRWWLNTYQREIEHFLQQPAVITPASAMKKELLNSTKRVDIPQLIQTRWNQAYPYNAHCPVKDDGQCYTGCIATAMAQVINYHQWPRTAGYGSVTYSHDGMDIYYDFTANPFDWGHMLDEYVADNNPSQQQCDAVANLMLACGASVRMQYGTDQSGAQQIRISQALPEYFGFDNNVTYLMRDYYTLRDWTARIYEELANGRPVIMGGGSEAGGHSFVCDGYDTAGLFHFNWGWGGYCDGYFALSALNPMDVGIGATVGDFNSDVDAVVNIAPQGKGTDLKADFPLFSVGDVTAQDLTVKDSNVSFILAYDGGFVFNPQSRTVSAALGVEITDVYGELIDTPLSGICDFSAPDDDLNLRGVQKYNVAFSIDGYEPGTYYIYPAAGINDGPMTRIRTRNGNVKFLVMSVGNDYSVNISNGVKYFDELEITDFATKTPAFANEDVTITFTATGMGSQLLNTFLLQFVGDHSADDYCIALYPLESEGNDTETYTFQGAFPLEAGEYNTYFKDWAGNLISDDFPLTIYSRNASIIKVTKITLDKSYYSDVVGTSCQLNATVSPVNATFRQLNWESSDPNIAAVNSDGFVRHLSPGRAEIYARAVDGSRIWNVCYVDVLPRESGIGTIDADDNGNTDTDHIIRVINTQGIEVYRGLKSEFDTAVLPHGTYILLQPDGTKKVMR